MKITKATETVRTGRQQPPHENAATPAAPSLERIVQAICRDASDDPVTYLRRSNTGTDGE